MEERKGFPFFRDWVNEIKNIKEVYGVEVAMDTYNSIAEYAFLGNKNLVGIPEVDDFIKSVWITIN